MGLKRLLRLINAVLLIPVSIIITVLFTLMVGISTYTSWVNESTNPLDIHFLKSELRDIWYPLTTLGKYTRNNR